MSTRINFTKQALAAIQPDSNKKRIYCYDTKIRGLMLDVTPNGTKTFRVYRKGNGRPERIQIGRFPDITVENARAKPETLNAKISAGEDPAAERRAIRKEMTLGDMFALYLERYAKKHKRSYDNDENVFRPYLTRFPRSTHCLTLASRSAHGQPTHSE